MFVMHLYGSGSEFYWLKYGHQQAMCEIHNRFSTNHLLAWKWSKPHITASHQLFWSTNRCPCCQPAGKETAEDIKPVLEVGQYVAASHITTLLLWTSACCGFRMGSSMFPAPAETERAAVLFNHLQRLWIGWPRRHHLHRKEWWKAECTAFQTILLWFCFIWT